MASIPPLLAFFNFIIFFAIGKSCAKRETKYTIEIKIFIDFLLHSIFQHFEKLFLLH